MVDLFFFLLSSPGCYSDGKDVEWQVPVMLAEKTLDSGVWCMPAAWLWSGTR